MRNQPHRASSLEPRKDYSLYIAETPHPSPRKWTSQPCVLLVDLYSISKHMLHSPEKSTVHRSSAAPCPSAFPRIQTLPEPLMILIFVSPPPRLLTAAMRILRERFPAGRDGGPLTTNTPAPRISFVQGTNRTRSETLSPATAGIARSSSTTSQATALSLDLHTANIGEETTSTSITVSYH